MITTAAIEQLETQLRSDREALKNGASFVKPRNLQVESFRPKPPKVILTKQIDGKTAILVITPVDLLGFDNAHALTRTCRLEYVKEDVPDTQSRVAVFEYQVKIEPSGIYLPVAKGRGRQRFEEEWRPFNPWPVFSGSKEDRKYLKSLGVKFR